MNRVKDILNRFDQILLVLDDIWYISGINIDENLTKTKFTVILIKYKIIHIFFMIFYFFISQVFQIRSKHKLLKKNYKSYIHVGYMISDD